MTRRYYRYHCNSYGKEFVAGCGVGERVKCDQCGSAWVQIIEELEASELSNN